MSDENSPLPSQAEGHAAVETMANPWPGLASYTEDQQRLFFGRTTEINETVRLVQRETLTVLFGRSGLGKSSLLRAGVMPRLREHGYFPVTLRLDFSERAEISPVEQVKALTVAAAREAGIEPEGMPENAAALTLWEWFHAVEFWGPRNDPVTPILALDQFEEVFTLGRNLPRTSEFIENLADLIENRVPQSVKERAESRHERLPYDAARQDYKVILSLREDFVPRLDSLRPVLPAIMRNRYALAPLTAECACAVVLGAGGKYVSEEDAKQIVAAVVGGDGPLMYRPDEEVEPAYLSVMCHELFRRMQALGRGAITRDLIDAERGNILEGLYTRSFEGIGDPVRFFVEDRLLTPSGFRGTLPLADATREGIAESDLRTLVDRRLLRFEDRLGTIHLELSHDLLTRIVLKRRESRRAEAALRVETERAQKFRAAQLAQRCRSRIVAGVAVALAVLLVGTVWGGYYYYIQEHQAFYRSVTTRRGFPDGIGELSPAQARQMPLHYVLVYKGIAWDGWRPHWRPAFKMMAADQRGKLTTKHGVGTFFWRAQDQAQSTELNKDLGAALGLGAVCQWEFTADAQGSIAYARGLDRDNRMVWGCVYSPAATGGSSTHIAHYVGPDGFPQLQNTSAAEYIEIHEDADGREARILFLDAMARPAPGPDGEFGSERRFDQDGNITSLTVLDERGQPMIDRSGNSGVLITYNKDGLTDTVVSTGLDGKPFAVFDGWTSYKCRYDTLGRLTLVESFDGEGKPVLRRSNVSAVGYTYDDKGDLVRESFLGTDGKPYPIVGEVVATKHETNAEGNEYRTTYLDPADKPSSLRDGTCGYESKFDARRNLIERTVFGADGKPFLLTDGYAGWKSEFDGQGREVRHLYYGVAGEPVIIKNGYHGWETQYDLRGNAVRHIYLGTDGKPTFTTEQLARSDSEFDQRGRETSRKFFGPAGEPVLHSDGNHSSLTTYDERGYLAEFTYLGLSGKPVVPTTEHYATQKIRHDTRGRETRRTYYDAADKPVVCKDGYHGQAYRYDLFGNVTEITTNGVDNLPIVPPSRPYARATRKYDPRARMTEQRYYDASDNPAKNSVGAFGARYLYDERGNQTDEFIEGAQPGDPAVDQSGVCHRRYEYDAWGRQIKIAAFGLHDEPVAGVDGAFAKATRYDAGGNWVESTWLDATGKPTANKYEYANSGVAYDECNNQVSTAYHDAAGQPCVSTDKTHRWVKKYDARRNVLSWEYFDVQGHLVVGTGGYAAIVTEYDPRGNEASKTYLGADGKPLLQSLDYATVKEFYAPSGLLVRSEYYDAVGRPVLRDGGYSAAAYEYDDAGRLRSSSWSGLPGLTAYATETDSYVDGVKRAERFIDAEGRLVNCAAGYAQLNMDYDATGALQRMVYRDAAGKPAYGIYGFAGAEYVNKTLRYYDTSGNEMRNANHENVRPLIFVVYVRSADCVAAWSGLQPGDVIWQVGEFSFPHLVDDVWEKSGDVETARKQMSVAWKSALGPTTSTPVRIAVIRRGELVELSLPEVPASGIGISMDFRRIPKDVYNLMVDRYGKPPAAAVP